MKPKDLSNAIFYEYRPYAPYATNLFEFYIEKGYVFYPVSFTERFKIDLINMTMKHEQLQSFTINTTIMDAFEVGEYTEYQLQRIDYETNWKSSS